MPADNLAYKDELVDPAEEKPRMVGFDEKAMAGKLRELQNQARLAETAAAAAKVGGTAMQAGGGGMRLAGKAAPAADVGSGVGVQEVADPSASNFDTIDEADGELGDEGYEAQEFAEGAESGNQQQAGYDMASDGKHSSGDDGGNNGGKEVKPDGNDEGLSDKSGVSSRLKSLQNKARGAKQGADASTGKISPSSAVSAGTSWLLRWAWPAIIPTFGFSILYIDLHVFCYLVFGEQFFCKLGREWVPKGMGPLGDEAYKKGGKAIELIEVNIFLLVNIIFWSVVGGALSLLVMVANWLAAGTWEKVKIMWDLSWDGLKALIDLFVK